MLIFLSRKPYRWTTFSMLETWGPKVCCCIFYLLLKLFFSTTLSFAPWFTLSCFSNMVKLVIKFMLIMYCWTTGRKEIYLVVSFGREELICCLRVAVFFCVKSWKQWRSGGRIKEVWAREKAEGIGLKCLRLACFYHSQSVLRAWVICCFLGIFWTVCTLWPYRVPDLIKQHPGVRFDKPASGCWLATSLGIIHPSQKIVLQN
jgi:hypothetical protein